MQSSKASCRTARKLQNESESTRDLQSLLTNKYKNIALGKSPITYIHLLQVISLLQK